MNLFGLIASLLLSAPAWAVLSYSDGTVIIQEDRGAQNASEMRFIRGDFDMNQKATLSGDTLLQSRQNIRQPAPSSYNAGVHGNFPSFDRIRKVLRLKDSAAAAPTTVLWAGKYILVWRTPTAGTTDFIVNFHEAAGLDQVSKTQAVYMGVGGGVYMINGSSDFKEVDDGRWNHPGGSVIGTYAIRDMQVLSVRSLQPLDITVAVVANPKKLIILETPSPGAPLAIKAEAQVSGLSSAHQLYASGNMMHVVGLVSDPQGYADSLGTQLYRYDPLQPGANTILTARGAVVMIKNQKGSAIDCRARGMISFDPDIDVDILGLNSSSDLMVRCGNELHAYSYMAGQANYGIHHFVKSRVVADLGIASQVKVSDMIFSFPRVQMPEAVLEQGPARAASAPVSSGEGQYHSAMARITDMVVRSYAAGIHSSRPLALPSEFTIAGWNEFFLQSLPQERHRRIRPLNVFWRPTQREFMAYVNAAPQFHRLLRDVLTMADRRALGIVPRDHEIFFLVPADLDEVHVSIPRLVMLIAQRYRERCAGYLR